MNRTLAGHAGVGSISISISILVRMMRPWASLA
jgi:hypothetical protein